MFASPLLRVCTRPSLAVSTRLAHARFRFFSDEVAVKKKNEVGDGKQKSRRPIYTMYPPHEMLKVRRKYQDLDFDDLRQTLEEADETFFSRTDLPQKVFHGQFMPKQTDNLFVKEKEKHMEKMMRLLPIKYHVLSRRRQYKHSGGVRISCTSICIGGNGKGVAGYGIGKGPSMQEAAERSKEHLAKNLHYLPLHEQRTLYQNVLGKHNQTRVIIKSMPRGRGIKGSSLLFAVLDCFGVSDASTKIIGRRNPITVLYAIFDGLLKTTPYRTIAQRMGVNYYRHFEPGYYRETPPTGQEMEEQTRKIKELLVFAERTYNEELRGKEQLISEGKYEEPRVSPHAEMRVEALEKYPMDTPDKILDNYALTQVIEDGSDEDDIANTSNSTPAHDELADFLKEIENDDGEDVDVDDLSLKRIFDDEQHTQMAEDEQDK